MLKKYGVKFCTAFYVGFCVHGNEPPGCIKGVNISDQQHDRLISEEGFGFLVSFKLLDKRFRNRNS